MIEGLDVMERTNSPTFCCRLTNKDSFSTDMYGCIFHSFSAWYNFCNFFPKLPADRRGPQFKKHCSTPYEICFQGGENASCVLVLWRLILLCTALIHDTSSELRRTESTCLPIIVKNSKLLNKQLPRLDIRLTPFIYSAGEKTSSSYEILTCMTAFARMMSHLRAIPIFTTYYSNIRFNIILLGAGVAQSVHCLTTDCTTGRSGFDPRQRQKDFSSGLCVQTASCPMGTGILSRW
jgi:hypothetical protein